METLRGVHRRGATLDIVHFGAFIDNDQRPLELAHILRVDAEIGLQGKVDLHSRRDVNEGAARPNGRVECRELVVVWRNDGAEILAQQIRMIAQGRVGVGEDHSLLAEIFFQRAVHDLALELGFDAGQELLLGLGNAQFLERFLDLLRHLVPGVPLAIGRLQIVIDVLKVDGDIAAPFGHRLGVENGQAFEPEVAHPFRLVLHLGDLCDAACRQTFFGLENRFGIGLKVVFVELADLIVSRLLYSRFGWHCELQN